MNSVAVFCGSRLGRQSVHAEEARLLGHLLAAHNLKLIYGGANVGLMATIANAVLEKGGAAIGVIPRFFVSHEIAHPNLTALILVDSMHERKQRMFDLADAIIALPGGFGTLDELFELITWTQIGLHSKPIAILNTAGYYDSLLAFIDQMVEEGFVRPEHRQALLIANDALTALNVLRSKTSTPPA
jgi:hypothetical protein